jgi:MFS family permease
MKGRWAVLALVALGTFMTTLDASIVNISLPSIARTFHTPIGSAVEWVIIAYLIVIAATLLTFGRLSDLVGRKSVWVVGLAIFTLGSIFCGAAGSLQAQRPVARSPSRRPEPSRPRRSSRCSRRSSRRFGEH